MNSKKFDAQMLQMSEWDIVIRRRWALAETIYLSFCLDHLAFESQALGSQTDNQDPSLSYESCRSSRQRSQ